MVKPLVCFLILAKLPFSALAQFPAGPVGYVTVPTTANKYQAYANPLGAVSNVFGVSAPNLLSRVLNLPETASPSRLLLWTGTNYDTNSPSWTFPAGWSPDEMFPPGQGGMLRLPLSTSITVGGEILTGILTNAFPPGYALRSSIVPQSGTVDLLGLSATLQPGDGVLRWDVSAQRWNAFLYRGDLGNWNPSVPSLNVAESCFIVSSNGGLWIRSFSAIESTILGSSEGLPTERRGTSPNSGHKVNPSAKNSIATEKKSESALRHATPEIWSAAGSKVANVKSSATGGSGYVIFANCFGPLRAPISDAFGRPLGGTGYQAAIQCSSDGIHWPSPVGPGVGIDFDASSVGPGYFFGGTYDLPVTGPTWLRLLVWKAGVEWEFSQSLYGGRGASPAVWVDVPSGAGDSPVPPPILGGLQGFNLRNLTGSVPMLLSPVRHVTTSPGQTVTLAVSASGDPPLDYFWQLNGTNIPGLNTASLIIPAVDSSRVGSYSVIICNLARCITNSVGVLSTLALRTNATLQLEGPTGRCYQIESSDDLGSPTNWTVLTNIVLETSPRLVTDPVPSLHRFYRAFPR